MRSINIQLLLVLLAMAFTVLLRADEAVVEFNGNDPYQVIYANMKQLAAMPDLESYLTAYEKQFATLLARYQARELDSERGMAVGFSIGVAELVRRGQSRDDAIVFLFQRLDPAVGDSRAWRALSARLLPGSWDLVLVRRLCPDFLKSVDDANEYGLAVAAATSPEGKVFAEAYRNRQTLSAAEVRQAIIKIKRGAEDTGAFLNGLRAIEMLARVREHPEVKADDALTSVSQPDELPMFLPVVIDILREPGRSPEALADIREKVTEKKSELRAEIVRLRQMRNAINNGLKETSR